MFHWTDVYEIDPPPSQEMLDKNKRSDIIIALMFRDAMIKWRIESEKIERNNALSHAFSKCSF